MDLTDLPLGLRYGLDIDVYHAGAGIGRSGLADIERAPAIYYANYLAEGRPPRPEPTPAMVLGTMTHTAILEPGEFDKRYAVGPKVDRRTTAGKASWADFLKALQPGQAPADADMVEQSRAMATSVRQIGPLRDLLAQGEPEVSAYWSDAPTGVLCKCRPDWVSPVGDGVILLDVKTCTDASPTGFAKSVANWGYDLQAAWYTDGFEAASGKGVHGFVFAAVEKAYPFAAAAYMLPEDAIDRARRKYRRLLDTYAQCVKTGVWPGFTSGDEIQLLTMPAWAMKEETE